MTNTRVWASPLGGATPEECAIARGLQSFRAPAPHADGCRCTLERAGPMLCYGRGWIEREARRRRFGHGRTSMMVNPITQKKVSLGRRSRGAFRGSGAREGRL